MKMIFLIGMVLISAISLAQNSKPSTKSKPDLMDRAIDVGDKIVNSLPNCEICEATGKVKCSNCSKWSVEYKRKVACHSCRDTRKNICSVCGGSGKFIKREIITSQEELDAYIDKNESTSSQYPVRPQIEKSKSVETSYYDRDIRSQKLANMSSVMNSLKAVVDTIIFEIVQDHIFPERIRVNRINGTNIAILDEFKIEGDLVIDTTNKYYQIYRGGSRLIYEGAHKPKKFYYVRKDGGKVPYFFIDDNMINLKGRTLYSQGYGDQLFVAISINNFRPFDHVENIDLHYRYLVIQKKNDRSEDTFGIIDLEEGTSPNKYYGERDFDNYFKRLFNVE